MLRCGNAETFHVSRLIVVLKKADAGNRVCALEINEVGSRADAGRLLAGDAAITEVVQLEINQWRIAGALQRCQKNFANGIGESAHGDGIPDFEQERFQVVGKPVTLRISVLNRHQDIQDVDQSSFGNGPDHNGQAAAQVADDMHPSLEIENSRLDVAINEIPCFNNVCFRHHLPLQVFEQVVLKA